MQGPQGFWGSGENGYLFSGTRGVLVVILSDFGSKLIVWGFGEPCKKVKKILTLKEKPSFCLIFFKSSASENLNVFTSCLSGLVLVTDMTNDFYFCGKISIKMVICRVIIKYFGTLRMRQIVPFQCKIPGEHAPDLIARV